ncbi:hypothetical protein Pint_19750 [Pistacia integerrima]|uniref:Uncharacterized protein n=1 Tax=Pistacia integerrima TaxID=434235 RepID=A0ACC0XBT4_9ROSI|nr:hypothetical protein Pint_19750 [Pistacia integerrima]
MSQGSCSTILAGKCCAQLLTSLQKKSNRYSQALAETQSRSRLFRLRISVQNLKKPSFLEGKEVPNLGHFRYVKALGPKTSTTLCIYCSSHGPDPVRRTYHVICFHFGVTRLLQSSFHATYYT